MTLRRAVFLLASVALLLFLVQMYQKNKSDNRSALVAKELEAKYQKNTSLYESLLRNQGIYVQMDEAEHKKLRSIYRQITNDPDWESLEKTMSQYHDWLQSLKHYDRITFQNLPYLQRVEAIKDSIEKSKEELSTTFSDGRPRGGVGGAFRLPLQNIDAAPFLAFFEKWLDQKSEALISSMTEEQKTELQKKLPVLSQIFDEKSSESLVSSGLWTKAAVLRIVAPKKSAETPLFSDFLNHFSDKISAEEFQKLLPEEFQSFLNSPQENRLPRPPMISFVFSYVLREDILKHPIGQSIITNRFNRDQMAQLGKILEFLTDAEVESVIKSPPDQFGRKVAEHLFFPETYPLSGFWGRRAWSPGSGPSGPGGGPFRDGQGPPPPPPRNISPRNNSAEKRFYYETNENTKQTKIFT